MGIQTVGTIDYISLYLFTKQLMKNNRDLDFDIGFEKLTETFDANILRLNKEDDHGIRR